MAHMINFLLLFFRFQLYTEALELEKRDDIYCNRAQASIKLEKYKGIVDGTLCEYSATEEKSFYGNFVKKNTGNFTD